MNPTDPKPDLSKERLLEDVTVLASIENRGPATPGEAKAARHVHQRMQDLGLAPATEPFRVIPHFPIAWVAHNLLCLLACFLAFRHPFLAAAAVAFVIVSYIGDTTTLFYLIRRLFPGRESRHVIGHLKPTGAPRKRIVIAAHMDAGQMGFSLDPKRAEPVAKWHKEHLGIQPPILVLIFWIMIFNLISTLLYGFVGFTPFTAGCLIIGGLLNLIPIVIFTPHEFAKISPGANDNGAGVAVMLDLARRLTIHPPATSEVMFVGVGSEETYMHGMACFMDERRSMFDKSSTYFLIPESCGNGTPRIITGEGVAWIKHFDPALCGAALMAARKLGYHEAAPVILRTGGTDATPPAMRGYAATAICCMNENDYVPNYHWTGDTPDNVHVDDMKKVADIFEETVRTIDSTF